MKNKDINRAMNRLENKQKRFSVHYRDIGNYIVFSSGEVESKKLKRPLKQQKNNSGYLQLNIDGKWDKVHRIVWKAFFGEIPEGKEIHHIDHNKENNNLYNLEAVTKSENIRKSFSEGNRIAPSGKNHWNYGKKVNSETKKKMSKAKKGENHPKFRGYYVINGHKYASALEASKAIRVSPGIIRRRCKSGKHEGWSFEEVIST